ncbi:MAG: EutN/CcmL family microcompartment protein [Myxococcota bacterium]
MKLARVVGSVVATQHHPDFDNHKLMLIRPERPKDGAQGEALGHATLAVDLVQAGPGDLVLVLSEGTGVRQLLGDATGPIRSVIVAIVDAVDGAP